MGPDDCFVCPISDSSAGEAQIAVVRSFPDINERTLQTAGGSLAEAPAIQIAQSGVARNVACQFIQWLAKARNNF
jgi:hypothetical protein